MDRKFRIVNRTKDQLREMVTPKSVVGGNLQAIPYVLFDTQTYISGTTVDLPFFQEVQQDQTLSNLTSGAQLPIDEWLEIEWMFISPIIPATNTDATGSAWRILDSLMWTGRPTHTLTIQNKDYGILPTSFFHSEGGISGYGYNQASVATSVLEYANWGHGVGYWVGGQIVLPPQAGFNTRLRWNGPVTVAGGNNVNIRVSYLGTLHRPIL